MSAANWRHSAGGTGRVMRTQGHNDNAAAADSLHATRHAACALRLGSITVAATHALQVTAVETSSAPLVQVRAKARPRDDAWLSGLCSRAAPLCALGRMCTHVQVVERKGVAAATAPRREGHGK